MKSLSGKVAFADACVLYPASIRSFLIFLDLNDVIKIKWTEKVHEEWMSNLLKNKDTITRNQLERTKKLMNEATIDSTVTGYEKLIENLHLPDKNDNHVLAAAIHGKCNTILTFNLNDFPEKILKKKNIIAQHPDKFLSNLLKKYKSDTISCVLKQHISLKKPAIPLNELFAHYSKAGLVTFSQELVSIFN